MKPLRTTFQLLSNADIAELEERIALRDYTSEAVVLREGDRAQRLYIVLTGRVRIEKNYLGTAIPVAELGEGELFGEMSFVENTGASATVVADTVCEIGEIDAIHVHTLLSSVPGFAPRFYHSLALLLSRRLRHTTQSIMPGMLSA